MDNFSRLPEQTEVLQEITEIADSEKADCIIIAGDLFDSFNRSGKAVELFYKTLQTMAKDGQCPVISIAGDHAAPDRIQAPGPLARECGIILAGNPEVKINPFQLASGLNVKKSDHGFLELEKQVENLQSRVAEIDQKYHEMKAWLTENRKNRDMTIPE